MKMNPGEESSGNKTSSSLSCPSVPELNPVTFVLSMTFLIALDLFVIVGNCLVITAIVTQPKLRSVNNVFVTSLATSDLLLGVTVLPFSSAYEVLGRWIFGATLCSAWLAIDVWLCTASILNLCAISVDRFLAISRPIKYPALMTRLTARVLVVAVWVVSFGIAIPPLMGWTEKKSPDADSNVTTTTISTTPSGSCQDEEEGRVECLEKTYIDCEFLTPKCALTSERCYVVYSACGSIWFSMFLMVFFYARIYRTAVLATDALRMGVLATKPPSSSSVDPSSVPGSVRVHRGGSSSGKTGSEPSRGRLRLSSTVHQSSFTPSPPPLDTHVTCPLSGSVGGRSMSQLRRQWRRLNRETKAAKTVGVVVGCFVLCWAPFFTVYLVDGFCGRCTPRWQFSFCFWLGYCNSVVNPLLYGLCSKEFGTAFLRLLSRRGSTLKRRRPDGVPVLSRTTH